MNTTNIILISLASLAMLTIYLCHQCVSIKESFTATALPFRRRYERHGIALDKATRTICKAKKRLGYMNSFNSKTGDANCHDKVRTSELLAFAGLPVARFYEWDHNMSDRDNLSNVKEKVGFPVVVKPSSDHKGHGVKVGLTSDAALLMAVRGLYPRKVIVEEQVVGWEYRVNVLKGEVIGVTKRTLPSVTGEGTLSISQLVSSSGQNRQYGIHTVDYAFLKSQGLSKNYRPKKGEKITVSHVANYSNGGGIEFVDLCSIHADNINMFRQAARTVKIDNVGFDYISPVPLSSSNHDYGKSAIIDMNSRPGFHVIYNTLPTTGQQDAWIDRVLTILFK
tara:strand:+ start:9840 stop:10850 length:1011 start_codon:yes stop_codon:yes gene_type:complete